MLDYRTSHSLANHPSQDTRAAQSGNAPAPVFYGEIHGHVLRVSADMVEFRNRLVALLTRCVGGDVAHEIAFGNVPAPLDNNPPLDSSSTIVSVFAYQEDNTAAVRRLLNALEERL